MIRVLPDKSGEVRKARIPPRFAGFFVSVVVREHPAKSGINSQTANAALKCIGYSGKLVAHGLRSLASTAMNEAKFNTDVIEAALAHSDKNEVRKAYNRSTH